MQHSTGEKPCPKCGAPTHRGAYVCLACDYILDVSAVAEELPELSDEAFSELSGVPYPFPPPVPGDNLDDPTDVSTQLATADAPSWANSAVIIGDPSRPYDDSADGWLSEVTSASMLPEGVRSVPIDAPEMSGAAFGDFLDPGVVLAVREGAPIDQIVLSVAEQALLPLINGVRPVARLARKAGLDVTEARNALGLLLDRKLLLFVARLEADSLLAVVSRVDDDDSGQVAASPAYLPPAAAGLAQSLKTLGRENETGAAPTDFSEQATVSAARRLPPTAVGPAPALTDLPSDAMMPLPVAELPSPQPEPAPQSPWGEATAEAPEDPQPPAPRSEESIFHRAVIRPPMAGNPIAASPPIRPAASRAERTGFAADAAGAAVEAPIRAASPRPSPPPVLRGLDAGQQTRVDELLRSAIADIADGRRTRAQAQLRMVLQLDSGNQAAHTLLQEHIGMVHAAMPVGSANDDPLLRDAAIADSAGNVDKALRLLREAGGKQPRNPEIYNRIAIILALKKRNPMAAALILVKACELAPENAAYRSNLGKVCKMSQDDSLNPELVAGDLPSEAPPPKGSLLDRLRSRTAPK